MNQKLGNFLEYCNAIEGDSLLRNYQHAISQLIVERGGDPERNVFPITAPMEPVKSLYVGMASLYEDSIFLKRDFQNIGSLVNWPKAEIREVPFHVTAAPSKKTFSSTASLLKELTRPIPSLYERVLKQGLGQESPEYELLNLMIQWYPEEAQNWLNPEGVKKEPPKKQKEFPKPNFKTENKSAKPPPKAQSNQVEIPKSSIENQPLQECRYIYPIDREVSLWLGSSTFAFFFILFSALGWIWTGIILGFAAFALTYIFHLSQAEVIFREDGAIFLNKDETLYVLSFEDILRVEFYDDASPGGMKIIFFSSEIQDIEVPFHFHGFARLEKWIQNSVPSRILQIYANGKPGKQEII